MFSILSIVFVYLPLSIALYLVYYQWTLGYKFRKTSQADPSLPETLPGQTVFGLLYGMASKLVLYVVGIKDKKHQIDNARSAYQKYGSQTGLYLVPFPLRPAVAVCGPEAAKQVFSNWKLFPKMPIVGDKRTILSKFMGENVVFTDGETWKRMRMMMNPSFRNIERFGAIFAEKSKLCLERLNKTENLSQPFKAHPWMMRMTVDILGSCVFDFDFDSLVDNTWDKYLNSYHYLMSCLVDPLRQLVPATNTWPLEKNRKIDSAIADLDELVYKVIQETKDKKAKGIASQSLLSVMLDAVDEESNTKMTDKELRDNIIVFFIAGLYFFLIEFFHVLFYLLFYRS